VFNFPVCVTMRVMQKI